MPFGAWMWIKRRCLSHLKTYEGYIKAVQANFSFKYQIPVLLSESEQYIPTKRIKDYDHIWINAAAVKCYAFNGKQTTFIFYSGNKISISISKSTVNRLLVCLKQIDNFQVKPFHLELYRKSPEI